MSQPEIITIELAKRHSHMTDLAMFVHCEESELSVSLHDVERKCTTPYLDSKPSAGSDSNTISLQGDHLENANAYKKRQRNLV